MGWGEEKKKEGNQVEVVPEDDESVLDPLLNAPCFGCKNNRQRKYRRPKHSRPPATIRDVVSRTRHGEAPTFTSKVLESCSPTFFPPRVASATRTHSLAKEGSECASEFWGREASLEYPPHILSSMAELAAGDARR
jgi:hypothetical protein